MSDSKKLGTESLELIFSLMDSKDHKFHSLLRNHILVIEKEKNDVLSKIIEETVLAKRDVEVIRITYLEAIRQRDAAQRECKAWQKWKSMFKIEIPYPVSEDQKNCCQELGVAMASNILNPPLSAEEAVLDGHIMLKPLYPNHAPPEYGAESI